MKVIDLLNKIANGEEVPKKIEYNDDLYTHVDNYCYFCEETNEILSKNIYAEFSRLNDEVEIIEEDKPLEELDLIEKINNDLNIANNYSKNNIKNNLKYVANKINELIDEVNKLKKEVGRKNE